MNSQELRQKFLDFMQKNGHQVVPSTDLVPENDPSALFVSAGVQPLVPYVLGEKHPLGDKITNIQKCVRSQDIEEVGDKTHDTFFEMMGYWSFGNYFKEQSIKQLYTFFTKELGLDQNRLYVTCFVGNDDAPKDTESAEVWKSLGIPENRIFYQEEDNWWAVGDNGPCGPDTEVFYDVTENGIGDFENHKEFLAADDRQDVVEIANSVFMQFEKKDGKVIGELPSKNVDMGSGFERVLMAVQSKDNIFDTDLFSGLMVKLQKESVNDDLKSRRIVADHIRTSVFMISDGVLPSNTEQGYVLRRLIRRAVRFADKLGIENKISSFVEVAISPYGQVYKNLENTDQIEKILNEEEDKFKKTLNGGLKQFEKLSDKNISGEDAFKLFSTYGFPVELTQELAKEKGISVDLESYQKEFEKHQETSRTASAGKFKGGLAGDSETETKYHTATHLLNAALRQVLGDHIEQKGSNITSERLRFDFSHPEKMTDEEKKQVEEIVNQKISEGLNVTREEMSLGEAKKLGAVGVFDDKYGKVVSVYIIADKDGNVFSRELCGGPHIENISNLGIFKIKKEEAISAGVRRIKAILE